MQKEYLSELNAFIDDLKNLEADSINFLDFEKQFDEQWFP